VVRVLSVFVVIVATVVAVHDLGSASCDRWYRVPLQLASDLVLDELPLGHPLYELAYGSRAEREIVGYVLPALPSLVGPREGVTDWTDIQSGALALVPILGAMVVMPPAWQDRDAFLADFERANPEAMPFSAATVPPFILVQIGRRVEGLELQALLQQTGVVTVWSVGTDPATGSDILRPISEERLSVHVTEDLFASAVRGIPAGTGQVDWNCSMLDGCTHSLIVFDGERLSRGHWVNCRARVPPLLL
jgi:hypothetical protein